MKFGQPSGAEEHAHVRNFSDVQLVRALEDLAWSQQDLRSRLTLEEAAKRLAAKVDAT